MVVAGDHVLGAEVEEGADLRAAGLLDITLVALGDAVGERRPRGEQENGERAAPSGGWAQSVPGHAVPLPLSGNGD